MEQKFCQSCGMPLTNEILGTKTEGSKCEDYCIYCFKNGKFTKECTMEEMIEFCSQFVDDFAKIIVVHVECPILSVNPQKLERQVVNRRRKGVARRVSDECKQVRFPIHHADVQHARLLPLQNGFRKC